MKDEREIGQRLTNAALRESRMKTTVHYYRFDLRKDEDKAAYQAMVDQIKSNQPQARGRKMHALGDYLYGEPGTSEEVEIEPQHLFDNQWNTTDRRVFDWAEEAIFFNGREQKHLKKGHWLELTEPMAKARITTSKCGYCGKQYGPLHADPPEDGFCHACLDSPYLNESDLRLLRLQPLTTGDGADRPELGEHERESLLPEFVERQTTGADSRAKAKRDKQRRDAIKKCDSTIRNATIERDGKLWLLDRGFTLDNVIYYSHRGTFCFGWRGQGTLDESVKSRLLDVLSEFPFEYEIKSDKVTA